MPASVARWPIRRTHIENQAPENSSAFSREVNSSRIENAIQRVTGTVLSNKLSGKQDGKDGYGTHGISPREFGASCLVAAKVGPPADAAAAPVHRLAAVRDEVVVVLDLTGSRQHSRNVTHGRIVLRKYAPEEKRGRKRGRRIHSMISMMRTGSGSPCVIHGYQERSEFDQALARRLSILAVKASRIKRSSHHLTSNQAAKCACPNTVRHGSC